MNQNKITENKNPIAVFDRNTSGWLWNLLVNIIPLFIIWFGGLVMIYFKEGGLTPLFAKFVAGVSLIMLFIIIISIMPFVNYWKLNKDDRLLYNELRQTFKFERNGSTIEFAINDIDSVVFYYGYWLEWDFFFRPPWDEYSHSIVYLKSGKSLVLTDIIFPDYCVNYCFHDKLDDRKSLYRSGFGLGKYMRI